MKFILLFGPPAVGKMTVGQELAKLTGLKLFHNHMTIELVLPFFDFGSLPFKRLVNLFRKEIFKEIAKSDSFGLIFTLTWAFALKSDEKFIDTAAKIFNDVGADVYYVELEADRRERIKRNKMTSRLQQKPSKRDIKSSARRLQELEQEHRFNTKKDEFKRKNYFRIDNTKMSAKQVARMIKKAFKL